MADVGRQLRAAREGAGLTLEDISARTKIGVTALQALEREDFDRLPGDFYARAFLRNYAREVKLPPDQIVREFDEIRAPLQPPAEPVVVQRAQPAQPKRSASPVRAIHPDDGLASWLEAARSRAGGWLSVAVAIVLLLSLTVFRRPSTDGARDAGAVATAGVGAVSPSPAGTTGKTPAPPDKLVMEIRPTAPIWVAATADGNSAIYRLLQPGERVTVEAQNELSFRIGNAAAFVYTLNGAAGKPLGGPDEVREFEITRQNYLSFRQ